MPSNEEKFLREKLKLADDRGDKEQVADLRRRLVQLRERVYAPVRQARYLAGLSQ